MINYNGNNNALLWLTSESLKKVIVAFKNNQVHHFHWYPQQICESSFYNLCKIITPDDGSLKSL